ETWDELDRFAMTEISEFSYSVVLSTWQFVHRPLDGKIETFVFSCKYVRHHGSLFNESHETFVIADFDPILCQCLRQGFASGAKARGMVFGMAFDCCSW